MENVTVSSRRNPFGLGWALVGACPGPIYILIGWFWSILIVLLGALLGTYLYGFKTNCLTNEILQNNKGISLKKCFFISIYPSEKTAIVLEQWQFYYLGNYCN
jgi:uncharacterized membrane protein YedE/YeeE